VPRISRDTDIYPISLRELEVLRVEDVTPSMRRITFGGPGLLTHIRDGEEVPALVSDGFDDDVRLILPDPDTGGRPRPRSLGDGRLEWTEQVNDLFRTYTVRKWTPDAGRYGELVIDFARHGSGLAESWSAEAQPGDLVYVAGPKNCGSHPSHTDWLLLIGDETALPAIGRCLEECPAGHPVTAVVEVPSRADIQEISTGAALDMHWVVRDEGGDFTDEILRLGRAGNRLPSGTPFIWAAGEAGRLKKIRAFARRSGVPREHVQITGYWRRNDSTGADGAGTSSVAPLMQLYEMADITPGLALRAAAQLGVFEAVDAAGESGRTAPGGSSQGTQAGAGSPVVTPAVLAPVLGVDAALLLRFLRYLGSLGLVELDVPEGGSGGGADGRAGEHAGGSVKVDRTDGDVPVDAASTTGVRLTSLGRELADPEGPVSRLTGPESLRSLAWLHLVEGLRTAGPVAVEDTGKTWAQLREADPAVVAGLADAEATRSQWVAPALAQGFGRLADRLTSGQGLASVAVAGAGEGTGAAVYADELLRHHPDLQVVVLDTGVGADRLTAEVGPSRRDRLTVAAWDLTAVPQPPVIPALPVGPEGRVGAVVVVDPYALVSPGEVPALLESAAAVSPRVVVVTRLLAETGDEDHDYAEDLTRQLLDARAVPTARDVSAAVASAGLTGVADLPVGWGSHAVVTLKL